MSMPIETAVMTITHFEHLGPVTVRVRTNRDIMMTIPSLTDKYLGDNMAPSVASRYAASLQATMAAFVVEPKSLVDRILDSADIRDLQVEAKSDEDPAAKQLINVFQQFSKEYEEWIASRIEDASQKKSGAEITKTGKEPAS
jgi:hypothetical protein